MKEEKKADINAAKDTICSAISDWTKTEYKYGDPIHFSKWAFLDT